MTKNPDNSTCGIKQLRNGYRFIWLLSAGRHPEVWGSVESPEGALVKGSSGYYRTDDPNKAAECAAFHVPASN